LAGSSLQRFQFKTSVFCPGGLPWVGGLRPRENRQKQGGAIPLGTLMGGVFLIRKRRHVPGAGKPVKKIKKKSHIRLSDTDFFNFFRQTNCSGIARQTKAQPPNPN